MRPVDRRRGPHTKGSLGCPTQGVFAFAALLGEGPRATPGPHSGAPAGGDPLHGWSTGILCGGRGVYKPPLVGGGGSLGGGLRDREPPLFWEISGGFVGSEAPFSLVGGSLGALWVYGLPFSCGWSLWGALWVYRLPFLWGGVSWGPCGFIGPPVFLFGGVSWRACGFIPFSWRGVSGGGP